MGAGLPVIASTAGAGCELVTVGKNGYLVAPETVEPLRQQIHTLIRDRQLLAEMGLQARQKYEQHPTWEQTGIRATAFLKSLLG